MVIDNNEQESKIFHGFCVAM